MDANALVAIIIGVGFIAFLLYQANNDKNFKESSCEHQWETIKEIDVYQYDFSRRPCGVKYILRCKKCGDIKEREFKG